MARKNANMRSDSSFDEELEELFRDMDNGTDETGTEGGEATSSDDTSEIRDDDSEEDSKAEAWDPDNPDYDEV